MPILTTRTAVSLVTFVTVIAGCGSSSPRPVEDRSTSIRGTITVSAASSLTGAFGQIARDFSAQNPEAKVTLNFGPSSTLATQLTQGAPADVFASADAKTMQTVAGARLTIGTPSEFATNRLVIVTKTGNPHHVTSLADLADLDTIALCGTEVPCGKYASQTLKSAGVTIDETHITRGADAKATLAAVTTGDADAAIVYVTDAKSAGAAVTSIAIPARNNVIAAYPIAALTTGDNATTAKAFVRFVRSNRGEIVLRRFGFHPAP